MYPFRQLCFGEGEVRKIIVTLTSMALTCFAGVALSQSDVPGAGPAMLGFAPASAARERDLEQRFNAQLSAAEMRGWLQQLSSAPNQVGSPHDKANAEFLLAQFKKWGWDAHMEIFDVLYPTPREELVEMVAPTRIKATLREPPVKGDRTSGLGGALPPYNIYGAVGCLIYSDPRDDGYFNGDAYPKGPWRPAEGVQRGSVMGEQYPGDPTTPGYGSVPGAKHLAIEDAKTILKIPVLPMSYADAAPMLKALGGPVAPESWRGALPFTYHIGSGPAEVHLVVKSDWGRKPIYDVIATLKGTTDRNEWVVRGNHRDGWVFGAWDPLSGTVVMMEEAKVLGALYRQGWRPARTLVYGSWDGEEAGLVGSTEWLETHDRELQQKAVVYINTDDTTRGFLAAGGSLSLQHMVNQVAAGVIDPEMKGQRAATRARGNRSQGCGPGFRSDGQRIRQGCCIG